MKANCKTLTVYNIQLFCCLKLSVITFKYLKKILNQFSPLYTLITQIIMFGKCLLMIALVDLTK